MSGAALKPNVPGVRGWLAQFLDFNLREWQVLLLLLAAGAVSGISYLFPGCQYYGDVWPHLVRIEVTYQAFRAGHLPDWSFYFYNGYPLLRFYSPLFYYLAAPVCFLTGGNPFAAAKIALFLLHVGSGFAAYALARRLLGGVSTAFVAAFCYQFSFWHIMYVNGLGRYPVGLVFAALPVSLWLFDRLLERPTLVRMVWAGLGLALLPLAHFFYAVFWVPVLFVWTILRVLTDRDATVRRLLGALGAGLVALLASAFFLVPFLVEGPSHRMLQPQLPLAVPSVLTLLGLSQEMSGYSGGYLGLGILALAGAGVTLLARQRRLARDPVFWALVLSTLMSFSSFLPLAQRIPLLGDLSTERFLVFVLILLALLAGLGCRFLSEKLSARWLWLPAVLLVVLDFGARLFNNVYREQSQVLSSREYVYQRLSGRADGRVLDIPVEGKDPSRRLTRYPASGYLFAGLSSVYGPPYHQFAPSSMYYAYAWADNIAEEFLDSTREAMPDRVLQEMRLLGAKYLVTLPTHKSTAEKVTYVFLKRGLTWQDSLLRRQMDESEKDEDARDTVIVTRQPLCIGAFEGLTPVVVAPRAQPRPAWSTRDTVEPWETFYIARDWQQLPDLMGLNPHTGVARVIPTRAFADSAPSLTPLQCAVTGSVLEHERVELQLTVNAGCFARLAYSYYPELDVRMDGISVPFWETADHFILVRLTPGAHRIVIVPTTTRLRRLSGLLSLAAVALCAVGLVGATFLRPRRPARAPTARG
jgi:hypothetical protein